MPEMIPLSCNIFHEKGDLGGRAMAAIDVVLTCLPHLFLSNPDKRDVAIGLAAELQGMLSPASYDVRSEWLSAMLGLDTAPPAMPESAKDPNQSEALYPGVGEAGKSPAPSAEAEPITPASE